MHKSISYSNTGGLHINASKRFGLLRVWGSLPIGRLGRGRPRVGVSIRL